MSRHSKYLRVIQQFPEILFGTARRQLASIVVVLDVFPKPSFLTKFDSRVDFDEFHAKSENLFEVFIVNFILLLDVEVRDKF